MKKFEGSISALRKGAAAAGLAVAVLGLAACGGTAEAPAEAVAGQVPGLTISNARLVLAPVAGNPAAVYFDLAYEGEQGLTRAPCAFLRLDENLFGIEHAFEIAAGP